MRWRSMLANSLSCRPLFIKIPLFQLQSSPSLPVQHPSQTPSLCLPLSPSLPPIWHPSLLHCARYLWNGSQTTVGRIRSPKRTNHTTRQSSHFRNHIGFNRDLPQKKRIKIFFVVVQCSNMAIAVLNVPGWMEMSPVLESNKGRRQTKKWKRPKEESEMECGEYAVDEYKNDIHFILSPFSFCLFQGNFLGWWFWGLFSLREP